MSETAAHLVDHVIPQVPVRQWVLSLPNPLRLLLAVQPVLLSTVLQTYLADADDNSEEARALRPLHRGSRVCRIAFGPQALQKVLTSQGALPREISGEQKLWANLQGFSLHAGVRCGAGQRKTLERVCRYMTRRGPSQ
jgi:hypothetical protein